MNSTGVQQNRFTNEEWGRILDQIGYGNPHGPLWFLGMEEALPGNPKADPKIPERVLREWLDRRRLPFGTFEDFGLPPVCNPDTPTWKIMAKLARLLLHKAKSMSTNPRPFHLTFWLTTRSVVAKKDAILRPPAVARRAALARAQSPNARDGTMAVCASSRYPGNHRLCPCWFGNNTF